MKIADNKPSILIASSSLDKLTWGPVSEYLNSHGYAPIIYEADKVASGNVAFEMRITAKKGLKVYYDNKPLELEKIKAAWYRRPNMFRVDQTDHARQMLLDTERRTMVRTLWQLIPSHTWLNDSINMRHAEDKIVQLLTAQTIGFHIPMTIVTNRWEPILESLPDDLALKMHRGLLYQGRDMQVMYTQHLQNSKSTLPTHKNPFRGYWQPFIVKAREWRVTIVGDQVFSAAIYTTGKAGTDWRVPVDDNGTVQYRKETFPVGEAQKCIAYLRYFNLRYGAFDFIEDNKGRIIFLECNTNGQYGWLEDELGLPISQAIAEELIVIAES
jgi:glutathione synthase/RimK-type ligase-like ATP-grasp enzyme